MISDTITNATSNGSVPDILKGFDTIFGGWFIVAILFAFLIVLGMAIFSWSGDFLSSFISSSFTISVTAFILSLMRDSNGVQILGFDKVLIFVTILALLFVGKKIGE